MPTLLVQSDSKKQKIKVLASVELNGWCANRRKTGLLLGDEALNEAEGKYGQQQRNKDLCGRSEGCIQCD